MADDPTVNERHERATVPVVRRASPSTSTNTLRYRMLEPIGRGGMGEVIAARDEMIGREVAIKRMLAAEPTPLALSRFLREAQIQGVLDHPAIPPVHDLGHDADGKPYIVMKRLAGTTLADILDKLLDNDPDYVARYPRQRLLRAFADVCLAVELAHTRGIVHRDLKPTNIMLGEFGEVFVLDWGIAKVIGDFDPAFGAKRDNTPGFDVTLDGTIIGTPAYMAPEQRDGKAIDSRADVYALGCILYGILTLLKVDTKAERQVQPAERQVPPELVELVELAIARDVESRLRTARELGARVQQFLDGDRDLALRHRLAEQHLARATEAAAKLDSDEAVARECMREAGRALALEPALPGAAELVGRLMLEPPRTTPREVADILAAEAAKSNMRQARIGSFASAAYALFIPFLFWLGVRNVAIANAFIALALVTAFVSTLHVRPQPSVRLATATLIGNALLVALLTRMFSPFLIAPGIAAVTVMAMLGSPLHRRPHSFALLVTLMTAAVLVPWLLEVAGVLPPTMDFANGVFTIRNIGVRISAWPVQIGLVCFTVALVLVGGLISRALSRGDETAHRRLQLQAWQLRQLVPASIRP